MDAEERKRIDAKIHRLLREREVQLTYGNTADANRMTEEIASLYRERDEDFGKP